MAARRDPKATLPEVCGWRAPAPAGHCLCRRRIAPRSAADVEGPAVLGREPDAAIEGRRGRADIALRKFCTTRADPEVTTLGATDNQAGRGLTARGSVARKALAELVSQASIVAEAIEDGDTVSAGPVSMQSSCDCDHLGASQLLLTPEQVAEALAIGRTRVYELMASGSLPSIRLGRSRRVARHALADFIDRLSADASGS